MNQLPIELQWRVTVHQPFGLVKVENPQRVMFDGFHGEENIAQLAASAPDLLLAIKRLQLAAERREHHMGDPVALMHAKGELILAVAQAKQAINKAEHTPK